MHIVYITTLCFGADILHKSTRTHQSRKVYRHAWAVLAWLLVNQKQTAQPGAMMADLVTMFEGVQLLLARLNLGKPKELQGHRGR